MILGINSRQLKVESGRGYPPPRVFCKKRLELIDYKGVEFFENTKEAAIKLVKPEISGFSTRRSGQAGPRETQRKAGPCESVGESAGQGWAASGLVG
jgi:hypothetical protein